MTMTRRMGMREVTTEIPIPWSGSMVSGNNDATSIGNGDGGPRIAS
jgi:hypothetical protein